MSQYYWTNVVYLHSNCRGGLRKTHVFWNRVRNGPSRSFKVVDLGTNRKRVCNFLLVINSNLGHILPHLRDIAGILLRTTPTIFHPNFRGVPFGLDWRCCGSEKRNPKLIMRVINFELVQPICPGYINVTDGRTDGQTDGRLTIAIPRFALRASRGN